MMAYELRWTGRVAELFTVRLRDLMMLNERRWGSRCGPGTIEVAEELG